MSILEIQDLSKDFIKKDGSTQTVLSNVNLSINKGECFVVIGPNGSGKTTLLRILGLLEPPTQGNINYYNKKITNLSRKEKIQYRRRISFVRQKPVVMNTSVYKNIAYGLKIRDFNQEEIYSKVIKIMEIADLKGLENKNARSLSGGEMQRVAIAMNFVIDPEIYLLDEVSANLDPKNVILLEDFINKIKQDRDKTIIMSTHDRMEAIKFADRIGVLSNGKLTQIGNPSEIFTSPKDEFTALFVGYENIFSGNSFIDEETGLSQIKINDIIITASIQKVGNVKVCIRPESIGLGKNPPMQTSYRNYFKGNVAEIRDLGNICHVIVKCGDDKFLSTITDLSRKNLNLTKGSVVYINFKATDVKCL